MLNKKGQGLQVSTVILIILALLVLVILAVIVTGGFAEFAKKIGIVKSTTMSLDEAKLECQHWCNVKDEDNFCSYNNIKIDINANGEIDENEKYGCRSSQIGIQCSELPCTTK